MNNNALQDKSFLQQLDLDNNKIFYVKIVVLDENEAPLSSIEGRISSGSISIAGDSAIRRSGSLSFVAEETKNDLTNVDNMLSLNKKIQIFVGFENHINKEYDDIIWFKQGIFVITNPSISHSASDVTINLQFKDKMCLLNGECGGNLPASVVFDSYDQIIGYKELTYTDDIVYPLLPDSNIVYGFKKESSTSDDEIVYRRWNTTTGWIEASKDNIGERENMPQRFFDIIQTLVCNYGNEAISKIIINDVPLEIKNSVRYTGAGTLYFRESDSKYSLTNDGYNDIKAFNFNEDCGYIYTDFTYPGSLTSSIGDNVCSILDKIKETLGNYEYFYDIDGNFVFQQVKNYLNTQYSPLQTLSEDGFLLDEKNYYIDLSNNSSSVYTFEEGSALISAYSNNPDYNNIKNDFHIWGKNKEGLAIHYHLAIKEKPIPTFAKGTATTSTLQNSSPLGESKTYYELGYRTSNTFDQYGYWKVVEEKDTEGKYTGRIHIAKENETDFIYYVPTDWRAQLYCQGLYKKTLQQRPDIYEQELLDLFDDIYDMQKRQFKADIVNRPNDLKYWFDYILPTNNVSNISVDTIGQKIHSYQQDKINRLYNTTIPNVIMIDKTAPILSLNSIHDKCVQEGMPFSQVEARIYKDLSLGTIGYTAQECLRDVLYQYTDYLSSISITSIPIYYLDVNSRITVYDQSSDIAGDYIINSINLPLDAKSTMSISASRALERI